MACIFYEMPCVFLRPDLERKTMFFAVMARHGNKKSRRNESAGNMDE